MTDRRKPRQRVLPGIKEARPQGPAPEPTEPEKLRDIAASAPMRIMAPLPGVEGIVASGQFKTQHETGTAGPQASLNPTLRGMMEDTAFGHGVRPVYGYFSHGDVRDTTKSLDWDTDPRFDQVAGYGHTAFQLGEHMRKHTTYSWGDSLGASSTEVTKQGELSTGITKPGALDDPRMNRADSFYTEMHLHKRPTTSDVSNTIIYEGTKPPGSRMDESAQAERTSRTEEMLKGANMPHEVRKVGIGGQMVLPLAHEEWGDAHWKKVGPDEPGKDIDRQGWSGKRYAYETPADEQRQMVTTKSKWRPDAH